MEKSDESKRRSFFKEKPLKLIELSDSVSAKIFETHPFSFLTTQKNKDYADLIVKTCGVTEKAVRKILIDSFEADSIYFELLGDHHEASDQGKKIVKQYTKAIESLELILSKKLSGIGIQESIKKDVDHLKKERANWANLHFVHPEFKAEPFQKTATGMFANQAFNIFLYIQKCIDKTGGDPAMNQSIYELISELFMGLYDHPAFNATKKFTPKKIKEYCDNIAFHSKKKKTSLRKYLESL